MAASRFLRLGRCLRSEVFKTSRQPLLMAYVLLLVVASMAFGLLQYRAEREQASRRTGPAVTHSFGEETPSAGPDETGGVNGFFTLSAAGRAGLLLAAILMLAFSATQISGEATGGTLRLLLTRPISRFDILAGRAATLLLVCLALVMVVAATAGFTGLIAGGYGNVLDVEYGTVDYTFGELGKVALAALIAAPFALFAVACFGLLLSVIFESSATAVTVAVLLSLVGVSLQLVLTGTAASLNFLAWVDRPAEVLSSLSLGNSDVGLRLDWLFPAIAVPAASAALFLTLAGFLFARRDVHS